MNNAVESQEKQEYHLPTTLNLLHFRTPILDGTRIGELRQKLQHSALLENYHEKVGKFLRDLLDQKNKGLQRIDQAKQELTEDITDLESSIICSSVFLNMRKVFPDMSSSDFMIAYKASVMLNLQITSFAAEKSKDERLGGVRIILPIKENLDTVRKLVANSLNKVPPSFSQNKDKWKNFLLHDNNFIQNLKYSVYNPFLIRDDTLVSTVKGKTDIPLMSTTPNGLPDWLSEDLQEPSETAVKEELEEDRRECNKNRERIKRMNTQKQYIESLNSNKFKKTINWLSYMEDSIFSGKKSFTDFIIFLHARHKKVNTLEYVLKQIEPHRGIEPKQEIENIIKEYSEGTNLLKTPESFAIFIENQLIVVGAINSSNDLINDTFISFFTKLLNNTQDQEIENTGSKKAAKAVKYNIKPLVKILNEEEIDYIKELLKSSKGQSVESFIWELSDLLTLKFKANPRTNEDHTVRNVINEIKRFSATFLRKNWGWAYGNLKDELSRTDETKQKSLEPKNETVPIAPLVEMDKEEKGRDSDEIERIENTILELKKGNLADWKLLYSTNTSVNPNHIVEIEGDTLEKREESLENFIVKMGISSSVKPSSVIHTLNWLVTVPQEVEQIRMRKTVNGEVFKKIKRGRVRIFYIMDNVKKQIIFFLYQKKAWNYEF